MNALDIETRFERLYCHYISNGIPDDEWHSLSNPAFKSRYDEVIDLLENLDRLEKSSVVVDVGRRLSKFSFELKAKLFGDDNWLLRNDYERFSTR